MAKIIRNANGEKLYPVCGFQKSQHKLFYWENKAFLKAHEDGTSEKDYDEWMFWQDVCEYAHCIHDGLIYMPYRFYNRVKEAIVAYDLHH